MELLRGETVADRADRAPPMSTEEILDAILQTCEGVADAHARGIVHRDLKPANLFLTRGADGPFLKILDFGVSKFLEAEDDAGLTTTGNVVGSPSFAAPEQLTAPRDVGPKIDVWALGVTLYLLLGRELPFAGNTRVQVWMLVLNSTPVPLDELRPDLPRELCDAVMRCLEKDPDARPANVAELARSLEPFANRLPVSARIVALLEDATRAALRPDSRRSLPAPVRFEAPPSAEAAPPRRRRRTSLAIFGALTATMLACVVAAALSPRRGTAKAAAASEPAASAAAATAEAVSAEPPTVGASAISGAAPTAAPGRTRRTVPRDPRRDPRSYR
jgi:serine/threonine-protein kinase